MAARRHAVPVAHVEAGLRSHNARSQEELNRRMVADLATVHFAPTATAFEHLRAEGVPAEQIHVVGNTICDVLLESGIARIAPEQHRGVLFTAHRATNVDDPDRLATLVTIVEALADRWGPVVFPVHPRTADRLGAAALTGGLRRDDIQLVAPLDHAALLDRLAHSVLAVTDSGGIQEEAAWLGVPTVVLRATTPRWEGVHAGFAELCGLDVGAVLEAADRLTGAAAVDRISSLPCPYGDGHAATRIAAVLVSAHATGRLTISEPELASAVLEGTP
jgi:UDP-N-acetylglucosamine 2-epimerase (non-hydrolysing)